MKKLIFGRDDYMLDEDTDVDALRQQIAERMRGSAEGWLELSTSATRSVWIFVTPHVPVTVIESEPTPPRTRF